MAALEAGKEFDVESVPFHEGKPASGAWSGAQVIEFMVKRISDNINAFYILCPDNETSLDVDNVRMRWAMDDIVEDRPPLSRWHPEYNPKFKEKLEAELGK